jgi:two-component system sensor histidine kinase KdpD
MPNQAHQELSSLPMVPENAGTGRGKGKTALCSPVAGEKADRWLESSLSQYSVAFGTFVAVSLLNLWLEDLIGYQAIALVYLLAVVVLALFVNRGPLIFGTALTALGWSFLAAPPRYSFHISSFYDKMMFATYFVVALTIGQLTTRLRAHREAEIKTKLLAESERLGRTLLNSVSHELRTPIATITGAASGLCASGTLTPTQQKLATEIESASARLNRVVQSLLNAARLQSGQIRPKLDWCDVSDLIRLTLGEATSLMANHPVGVKLAAGLPLVKMDVILMGQVLGNLLVNAATHTPPGTPVEISARKDGKNLVLEVSDRGAGLPPDQVDRIFDLFHRLPTARPGGTGLGLAIVKGFVDAQGGHVQAANRPGGGAVFTVWMPASDAPGVPEEPL